MARYRLIQDTIGSIEFLNYSCDEGRRPRHPSVIMEPYSAYVACGLSNIFCVSLVR